MSVWYTVVPDSLPEEVFLSLPTIFFFILQVVLGIRAFSKVEHTSQNKYKIAFGLSWVVFILISYNVLPAYGIESWAAYFQLFPLSLFLSLQVWLGYQAFGKPTEPSHWGWKIAFWLNCVPGGLIYWGAVYTVLNESELSSQDVTIGLMIAIVVGVPFFVLQVMFAFFAFRKRAKEEVEKLHDESVEKWAGSLKKQRV